MSWVFATRDAVFKLKKPIRNGTVDFSGLAARRRNAVAEVRLNRRLAGEVYRGVVPLGLGPDGLRLGAGPPGFAVVDWLVEMRRLDADLFLDRLILRGAVVPSDADRILALLVPFYRTAAPAAVDPAACVDAFRQELERDRRVLSDPRFGLDPARLDAIRTGLLAVLADPAGPVAARAARGRIVEGHGDLRPEHVWLGEPPAIIDCLEFDRALRLVDPFDEVAYLGLECERLGAPWIGPRLVEGLADGLAERPPDDLIGFYRAARAEMRARFALRHLLEPSPREPAKWLPAAQAYLALAEASLRPAPRRA